MTSLSNNLVISNGQGSTPVRIPEGKKILGVYVVCCTTTDAANVRFQTRLDGFESNNEGHWSAVNNGPTFALPGTTVYEWYYQFDEPVCLPTAPTLVMIRLDQNISSTSVFQLVFAD